MHGQTCAVLVPYYQPTLPTGSTVVVIKKKKKTLSAALNSSLFFPICIKKKSINSQNFWARASVFFFHCNLTPPPPSFPCRQFGSCTLRHKSKTQLKGERHKEMTPARKRLVLGRALAGRKNQWEGTLPYTEMAQWEGEEEGVKMFFFLFSFFFL